MELSEKALIQLLALQYIQGKAADTASGYVQMYREAEAEIKAAYEATKGDFRSNAADFVKSTFCSNRKSSHHFSSQFASAILRPSTALSIAVALP